MKMTSASSTPGSQPEARIVRLDGTPEETAEGLIADSLPQVFLDQIDLASADGPRLFVVSLVRRRYEASLERAEVIAFVERNRQVLERTGLLDSVLGMLNRAAQNDDDRAWFRDVIAQMKHVLDGHPERVDLVSSRLLWLCIALDSHVSSGRLDHAAAARCLQRPNNCERITPKAVLYLLRDYIDSADELEGPQSEYVLLMAECALLANDQTCMNVAAVLLRNVAPTADSSAWLMTWRRLRQRLAAVGAWSTEDQAALDRTAARFDTEILDDDY
jgi:hypothetical protein